MKYDKYDLRNLEGSEFKPISTLLYFPEIDRREYREKLRIGALKIVSGIIEYIIIFITAYYVLLFAGRSIISEVVGSFSPTIQANSLSVVIPLKNTSPRWLSFGRKYTGKERIGLFNMGESCCMEKSMSFPSFTYLNDRPISTRSHPQMIGSLSAHVIEDTEKLDSDRLVMTISKHNKLLSRSTCFTNK